MFPGFKLLLGEPDPPLLPEPEEPGGVGRPFVPFDWEPLWFPEEPGGVGELLPFIPDPFAPVPPEEAAPLPGRGM